MADHQIVVMHQVTARAVDEYIDRPIQGLLITGLPGSGKASIARHIVTSIFRDKGANFEAHPYIRIIRSQDGKAIPIEAIRELQHFLGLKIPISAAAQKSDDIRISRAIVIEDAHLLTPEAQNALLKTLEEPPIDTILILTVSNRDAVLPTIQSRTRELAVLAPGADKIESYFLEQGFESEAIKRTLLLSGDLPGLSASLLAGDVKHPLVIATTHTRGILQSKMYERLLLVDTLAKQRELCLDILYILGQMSRMALTKTTSSGAADRWQKIMKSAYIANEQLRGNVQAKLVLTNLMLSF